MYAIRKTSLRPQSLDRLVARALHVERIFFEWPMSESVFG